MPWIIFLQRTGIDKEDIWPADKTDYVRSLFNAKLFPVWHCTEDVGIKELLWLQGAEIEDNDVVLQRWKESWRLSLQDISQCVDINTEFQLRRDMSFQIGQADVKTVLAGMENKSLLPFFKSAVVEGYSDCLLVTLDTVASETDSPGVAARTLACIADVLGCISALKGSGGLRSGPAANKAWAKAFHKLEEGNIAAGVMALAAERLNWMDRADLLVRAARHYEGAEQILIRHAVMTARQWIVARCPARIDISGGWSDTPPITYENGGAVTNAAITIDGKKPIGAKCRRIIDPHLVLVLGKDTESARHLVIKELCDLSDYTNPQSSAALLKAAFICADVISFKSGKSLQDQLMNKYGSGFELQTWSNLPQGSGLGTSSILAGAVIAAVWKASGRMYSNDSLIHAVLHLEQMLTTGGGWQDQVGGDIEKVGECLNTYWSQKKVMAPGCEPKLVGCMMEALKPSVYGQALAGAGGGGFMYVLTKKPNAIDDIKQVLTTLE
uniref:L-fucose kinase-like n=1 Tax=Saccoglossus kowalevskii TaxID=10224 RepID=A0ABM0MGI0_SACKO